jgi:hypothetical protein
MNDAHSVDEALAEKERLNAGQFGNQRTGKFAASPEGTI